MLELTCPTCGLEFPVLPVESEGWCACGMDYEIDADLNVTWMPDPLYAKVEGE